MNDEEKTSSKSSSMQPDLLRLIKWLELMTKKNSYKQKIQIKRKQDILNTELKIW